MCIRDRSDITPPLYLNMPGYFSERPAQTVKDKIYAKAVLFRGLCSEGSGADSMSSVSSSGQSEERTIAMVSIDANFITEDMVTRIKERICEHTDINEQDITVRDV